MTRSIESRDVGTPITGKSLRFAVDKALRAGHTSSSLALEVYARMMSRDRDTGARVDALLGGPDWAQTGTNEPEALLVEAESL